MSAVQRCRRRAVLLPAVVLLAVLLPAMLLGTGCGRRKPPPKPKQPAFDTRTSVGSADVGVPFYPNGTKVLGAGRNSTKDGSGILTAMLDSSDPVETVYAWYRHQMGTPLRTDILNADGTEPQAKLVKADGDDSVEVSIFQMAGKTRIVMTRHEAARPKPTKGDQTEMKGSQP